MFPPPTEMIQNSRFARDLLADCLVKPQPKRPFEIPWEQKTLWVVLFGAMLIIAIVGNCIVIWIVLGKC